MPVIASIAVAGRHSAVRFLVIGALSLVVDAGSLFLFHGVLRIWLPVATVLAYGVAFVVNFGLNRVWVFEVGGAVGRQVRRYVYLVAANLIITVILVQGLVWLGVPYLVAKVATAIGLAVVNYFVSRRWIFV